MRLLILILLICGPVYSASTDGVIGKFTATTAQPGIFVNQVGHRTGDSKSFVTNLGEVGYEVFPVETGRPVVKGTTRLRAEKDPATGMNVYWGDFSSLMEPGTYRIRLDNGLVSHPFKIGEDVYTDVAKESLRSFYLQRCGIALVSGSAGQFARPECHIHDARYHPQLGVPGRLPVSGGWHDAGDFGKYIHSAAASLAHMLMMYEQFPEKFAGDAMTIPESGNGIADFIDEMQFELEWMLKMQVSDPGDALHGGVHYMVNTRDYVWVTAEADKEERFLYTVSSVATADFAAAMALAHRVFRGIPSKKAQADRYLSAALLAWDFLARHPGLYPGDGSVRPADTKTGGYADSPDLNDLDDRLWAAVELALATGQPKFLNSLRAKNNPYLNRVFFESESFDHELQWQDTFAFPFMQAALHEVPGVPAPDQKRIREQVLENCDRIMERINRDGFAVALNRYYWGSAGGTLAFGQMLIFGNLIDPARKEYIDGALHQLHFVLGRNALNTSFVSGIGSLYPQAIHHATFENDDIVDIFPGLLSGGPNPGLSGDYTLPLYFDADTPPALCYIDHMDSWASNENCILYNAPLVALAFYFSSP